MAPELHEPQSIPRTPPSLVATDGRTYPLRSARIRSRADAGLAQTTLIQEFDNPHDEPLEVIYTMPLPADGAVLGYLVRMGERVIRGEIQTREKAETTYKEALFAGKTAGLLEQNRADTFQQRLGNLPARTKVEIEISVLHPLAFLLGSEARGPVWEYRFPTVVGVRYQGGPGRVTDAEKLDENRARAGDIPTRVALDLVIGDAAATAATSPSHEITSLLGADATHVHLAEGAPLDRDLIVQWPAATPDVGVTVAEGPGLEGDTGRYALIAVTPPAVPRAVYHRDLTILIDASGSMTGEPIETAKRIAAGLLASLEEGDRFELLAFASTVQRLTEGMELATPATIRKGTQKIGSLQAGGATEMESAIRDALSSLRADSQHQIVVMTDGDFGFEREVMESLSRGIPAGVRLHVVGIGAAPNRTLTFGLARGGRGLEMLAAGTAEAA
ncbi:MAG TPA: VIT domain-containing protein, partial [Candidatus Eisenbacteria bacterium]|nr:VIT domain-containing protein [Candidatus Eisenbacteria bacterium]